MAPLNEHRPTTIVRRSRLAMKGPLEAQPVAGFELHTFDKPRVVAQETSSQIIAEARVTAEQMVDHAKHVREGEFVTARKNGYDVGHAEGLAAADREAAGLIATAEAIAQNLVSERERILEQSEGEIIELAIAIAERIVNATISAEPDRVIDVCRGAMRKAFRRETITVRAHPDDLALLRGAGPLLCEELGGIQNFDVVEERRLQPGSVVVSSPNGDVDATFAAKAGKIEAELRELAVSRRASARTQRFDDGLAA